MQTFDMWSVFGKFTFLYFFELSKKACQIEINFRILILAISDNFIPPLHAITCSQFQSMVTKIKTEKGEEERKAKARRERDRQAKANESAEREAERRRRHSEKEREEERERREREERRAKERQQQVIFYG